MRIAERLSSAWFLTLLIAPTSLLTKVIGLHSWRFRVQEIKAEFVIPLRPKPGTGIVSLLLCAVLVEPSTNSEGEEIDPHSVGGISKNLLRSLTFCTPQTLTS